MRAARRVLERAHLSRSRAFASVLVVCLAAAFAGCGRAAPAGAHGAAHSPSVSRALARTLAAVARTHELPTPAPPERAPGERSAEQAVSAFATVYINWTAKSVSRQLAELALASVGQARSEMALSAVQTEHDAQLAQAGIANSGTVEAVAPMSGQPGSYVVVTRETTSASNTDAYQGIAPAWHVTVAMVVEIAPGRWVVSDWQPES